MDRDAHELADHDACDHAAEATDRFGVLASPLARRRFLQLGGLSAAGAAVLVACGGPGPQGQVPVAGTAASTTKAPDRVVTDATYFRTTSSMEASLVETYRQLLAVGTLPTDVAQTMKTFMDQHNEHLAFFQKLTTQMGGKEVSDPNPVVQDGVRETGDGSGRQGRQQARRPRVHRARRGDAGRRDLSAVHAAAHRAQAARLDDVGRRRRGAPRRHPDEGGTDRSARCRP